MEVIASVGIPVQFAFVREEKFMMEQVFPEGGAEIDHVVDCLVYGPFFYKEIFAIRCPKYEEKRNPTNGTKHQSEDRFNTTNHELSKLGNLPLEVDETGLVISGYIK